MQNLGTAIIGGGGVAFTSIEDFSIAITTSNTTNTATISSVDTAETLLIFNGCDIAASDGEMLAGIALTNATTITATRGGVAAGDTTNVRGVVIEFPAGTFKSIQSGTISSTGASNTATITAVDTSKSFVVMQGYYTDDIAMGAELPARVDLTNTTTVTAVRTGTTGTFIVHYTVYEYN